MLHEHFFCFSYSHLLPNDDEAFEHFDSFISRRIDEVGIPLTCRKFMQLKIVSMLCLLHSI
jgi:hypothetical protein